MSILFSRLLFIAHNSKLYMKILSSRLLKIVTFALAVVFLFWKIVLTELYARFVRIFLFWKSSSVPSLLPISLQFLQSFCPIFLMVYFSVLLSLTNKFLSLRAVGTGFSMFSRICLLVEAQLMSSAYCWSTVKDRWSWSAYVWSFKWSGKAWSFSVSFCFACFRIVAR